jgi:hypothetical protein
VSSTPDPFRVGDYVSPLIESDQHEIGVVNRIRRVRTVSPDLVIQWLTHTGCSYEFSSRLTKRSLNDPLVVAAKKRK